MINVLTVASRNPDKTSEIQDIFGKHGLQVKSLQEFSDVPEIIEDGNTLEENALKKAHGVFEAIGLPVIADDTGLEVDALNGAPGLFSARFAGENATYDDNVEKLLHEMSSVPHGERTARFRTVAAFFDGTHRVVAEGSVEGIITAQRRGRGGFGYDPVFECTETHQTFAEMTIDAKNAISHRSRAFRQLYLDLQNSKLIP
jgi:XTP/dITP diphosphohydrolase